jgi:hypothetical protein
VQGHCAAYLRSNKYFEKFFKLVEDAAGPLRVYRRIMNCQAPVRVTRRNLNTCVKYYQFSFPMRPIKKKYFEDTTYFKAVPVSSAAPSGKL